MCVPSFLWRRVEAGGAPWGPPDSRGSTRDDLFHHLVVILRLVGVSTGYSFVLLSSAPPPPAGVLRGRVQQRPHLVPHVADEPTEPADRAGALLTSMTTKDVMIHRRWHTARVLTDADLDPHREHLIAVVWTSRSPSPRRFSLGREAQSTIVSRGQSTIVSR